MGEVKEVIFIGRPVACVSRHIRGRKLLCTSDIPFNIDLGHINQGTNSYLFPIEKLLFKLMQPETANFGLHWLNFRTMLNEKSACSKKSAL